MGLVRISQYIVMVWMCLSSCVPVIIGEEMIINFGTNNTLINQSQSSSNASWEITNNTPCGNFTLAEISLEGNQMSHYLVARGWDIDLPSDSTIDDISILITRSATNPALESIFVNLSSTVMTLVSTEVSQTIETKEYPIDLPTNHSQSHLSLSNLEIGIALENTETFIVNATYTCIALKVTYSPAVPAGSSSVIQAGIIVGGIFAGIAMIILTILGIIVYVYFIRPIRTRSPSNNYDLEDQDQVVPGEPGLVRLDSTNSTPNSRFGSLKLKTPWMSVKVRQRQDYNDGRRPSLGGLLTFWKSGRRGSDGDVPQYDERQDERQERQENLQVELAENFGKNLSSSQEPLNAVQVEKQNFNIPFWELKMEGEIGKGECGVVYKATYGAKTVSVKRMLMEKMSPEEREDFLWQLEIMKFLPEHPNVLQLIGICSEPLAVVTQFMENGSLKNFLGRMEISNPKIRKKIILGIAKGMQHLHQNRVIHKDLAARNVLLSVSMMPRICDFGFRRFEEEYESLRRRWMAPESIADESFSEKSDVWSFGITVLEIYTRSLPFGEIKTSELVEKIVNREADPENFIPDSVEPQVKELLGNCFFFTPEARPDFTTICHFVEKSL